MILPLVLNDKSNSDQVSESINRWRYKLKCCKLIIIDTLNKSKYFWNQYANANSKTSIRKSLLIRLMTNRYYIKSVNFKLVFCIKIAEIFLFSRFLPRIWLWTGLSLSFSYTIALTLFLFLLLMLYQIAQCSHVTTRFVSP